MARAFRWKAENRRSAVAGVKWDPKTTLSSSFGWTPAMYIASSIASQGKASLFLVRSMRSWPTAATSSPSMHSAAPESWLSLMPSTITGSGV